jgi:hypothetical protein
MIAAVENPLLPLNEENMPMYYPHREPVEDDSTVLSIHEMSHNNNNNNNNHTNNTNTNKKNQRSRINEGKGSGDYTKKNYTDGYRCILKSNRNNTKTGKSVGLEYYATKNIVGTPIMNACTGYLYTQFRVGQKSEYLFFKVRLSTQESYEAQIFSQPQNQLKRNENLDPEVLFYDSPEEYEMHQHVELPNELKESWRIRYESLLRLMEKKRRETTYFEKNHNTPPVHVRTEAAAVTTSNTIETASSSAPPGLTALKTGKFRPPSPDGPPPGYVNPAIVHI